MDLFELLSLYIKRLWVIILCVLVFGVGAFSYTYFFVTPLYQSSALFYVNNSSFSVGSASVTFSASELTAAKSLVDTYIVILTSIPTLEEVIDEAGVDYTYSELEPMISASAVNATEIFRATVTAEDPSEAETIANAIARVLPDRIAEVVKGSDVSIVQRAVLASERTSPSYSKNTMTGAVIGAVFALVMLTGAYFIDENIRSEDYLTQTYPGYPLLGVIPDMETTGKKGYGYYSQSSGKRSRKKKRRADGDAAGKALSVSGGDDVLRPNMSFAVAEAFKLLRTSLSFSFSGAAGGRVIGVTSAYRGEGKSTISMNVAFSLAETGRRVLLVDADMRLSTMARRLGVDKEPGLSNLLAGMNSVSEVLQEYQVTMEDDTSVSMDVLIAGNVPPNPTELLGSEHMEVLIGKIRSHYDYIIIDLPPVMEVADALIVSPVTDGLMLVVRHDVADRTAVAEMIRQIQLVSGRVSGFVYNGAADTGIGYYKRHGYYKRRGYYKKHGYGYYKK